MNRMQVILGFIGLLVLGSLFFVSQSTRSKEPPQIPGPLPSTLQPTPVVDLKQLQSNAAATTPGAATPTMTPTPTVDNSPLPSTAVIKTNKGVITLTLYSDIAPKTVRNFVTKAKSGFYKNLTWHRVEDWVIQGGDPNGDGTGGGNIPVEFNDKPFVVGSLGVASRGDGVNQNDSQFFITKLDSSHLNGAYTNFGIVKEGMDVVNKIEIGDKILGITVQ